MKKKYWWQLRNDIKNLAIKWPKFEPLAFKAFNQRDIYNWICHTWNQTWTIDNIYFPCPINSMRQIYWLEIFAGSTYGVMLVMAAKYNKGFERG